ncbi:MAG: PEP-CTERM sorting domain-containing protein [bacterium]
MRQISFIFMSMIFLFGTTVSMARATSYSGSISSLPGGGLWANGGWSDGDWAANGLEPNAADATLSWNVRYNNDTNFWIYRYTFAVDEKSPSHAIIEVSSTFSNANIQFETTPNGTTPTGAPAIPLLDTYTEDNGNPSLPSPVKGIKWDDPGLFNDDYTVSWQIVTDRNPMWGDFYAKSGDNPNDDPYYRYIIAYNTGFGTETSAAIGDGNAGGWILVPDTTTPVPEPGTIVLLMVGFLGLGFMKAKKNS